ncbi:MAG: hypothetical protein KDC58_12925 [Cyclobacteriaceae bacterium]|nr:hypothetical protein [Cyclobacteriaceae bacterium]
MGSEVIIIPAMFLTVFGMVYYFLVTRNKERLALIEAGVDAKLFKSGSSNSMWYFVIVLGMLAIGISLGVGLGFIILHTSGGFESDYAPGAFVFSIFLFAGLSLLTSFFLIRKIRKQDGE